MERGAVMRDLLDTSTLRRVNFVELTLVHDHWWKMEDIAQELSCSESTVKSDIDYFRLSFAEDFHFESTKQQGIRLCVSQSFQMDHFYQRIMRECLNVQFLNFLFTESLHTLEEYAEAMYTSVSSVKRSIGLVRKVLKKYDLNLQQKPIRITGKEKQILFFYGVFFWEEYGTSFTEMNFAYTNEAFDFVKAFKEERNLSLSATSLSKMALWMTLRFERIAKNHHIEEDYTPLLPISDDVEAFVFEHTAKLPFPLFDKDIQFAGYYLESRYLYFSEKVIQSNSLLFAAYREINTFLTTLSESMSIHLENKKAVQNQLFHQFIYRIEFKGHNYTLVDQNKVELLNNEGTYTCFLVTAEEILKQMASTVWVDFVLASPNDFFYVLISTWENLTTEIFKQREKINTLIISQFGLHHEKFLKELTDIRFPYILNSYLFSEEDYSSVEIDLILTDHEVGKARLQVEKDIPVVGINYSPNNQNWTHLKKMIDEIFHQKHEND